MKFQDNVTERMRIRYIVVETFFDNCDCVPVVQRQLRTCQTEDDMYLLNPVPLSNEFAVTIHIFNIL